MEKPLEDNTVYIVKDGQAIKVEKPVNGFGKTTIHWQAEKPVMVETNYTEKL